MRALAGAECDRQPEQEPVAEITVRNGHWIDTTGFAAVKNLADGLHKLYTTPPQRTWVGLSREDCYQVRERESDAFMYGVAWAEAKLKEKNNG